MPADHSAVCFSEGQAHELAQRRIVEDVVAAAQVAALMATFGREEPAPLPGDTLPPLWHGLFCSAKLPPSGLGSDGLPKKAGLPPAVPGFPNRIFGGARYRFCRPLRIGQSIRRESAVRSIKPKRGRTGTFLVASVRHSIFGDGEPAVVEENNIILRSGSSAAPSAKRTGASSALPTGETAAEGIFRQTIAPDPVLMFRHSALTFNSHRIHYDRDFVRGLGFPGLMVQGTLIARLMLEMVRREIPAFVLTGFEFRSVGPIYDDGDFTLQGRRSEDSRSISLTATDRTGSLCMIAEATGGSGP